MMNGTPSFKDAPANARRAEITSTLFASMVVQQTNLALMLLGKMPHPETGQTRRDLESAKMCIDQLEMLEVKTKGNLDKAEEKLLKQSLTALRMAFVEAVDSQVGQPASTPSAPASETAKPSEPIKSTEPAHPSATPSFEEESRKKFSKKY